MDVLPELRICLMNGIRKAWNGFVWMLKIIVPISFLIVLVEYAGLTQKMNFILEPVMGLIDLPAVAALPLVIGLLSGIYGGIAAMVMLSLSSYQMTLIAVFLLISHNLIQEGIVQAKTGLNFFLGPVVRLTASVLTVIVIAQFLGPETTSTVPKGAYVAVSLPFGMVLKNWFLATLYLAVKMWIIMAFLMIFLETMKHYDVIRHVVGFLRPLLKIMGLDETVGMLWLTAAVFGITYGAAVIVEDARSGDFAPDNLKKLHISIGINHAMIEDPVLFLALGLNPLLLWLPRWVASMVATHTFSMWQQVKSKRVKIVAPSRRKTESR